ncbi:WD domain, G-beta repeat-containing protein [Saitoella complicata NRRL Y-17804]|uniref:WD domain, G-beta repeat-containing protein n=1 Tax=Saitoella complicata (strain BCRC 22490 / CBS 7301 / JCM 7358 / NBRC 10748 / NRRL Y-17804) TaxID=698492 RepID=UPI00086804F3|nr:WD domain, G-beta repeat-containing protein [Saitoella complicata NRRL Y-17804]ODQ52305.1 WD domain, G-beta repeat-containing protein [Saitoella complicata NRRL Y-17804]
MVKSYAKYEPGLVGVLGLVASAGANVIYANDTGRIGAGYAVAPALEEVIVWDVKKGEQRSRLRDLDCTAEVTVIARSLANGDMYAVGYSDGSIRIWELSSSNLVVTFNGHRSSVSALCFDVSGTRLASGSKDTDIIVWDVVAEVGISRLRGHKDQITSIRFLRTPLAGENVGFTDPTTDAGWLLTSSKDTFLKLWDLSTKHCVETHVAHRGEVWAMNISDDEKTCVTSGPDAEIKFWDINTSALAITSDNAEEVKRITQRGILMRQSKERPISLSFHPRGEFLACQGADRGIEIWRLRSEEEIKKKLTRKRKRRKEKAVEAGEEYNEEEVQVDLDDEIAQYVTVRTPVKARSFDWGMHAEDPKKAGSIQFLTSLTNNVLELYTVAVQKSAKKSAGPPEYERLHSIELQGHRSDIRALAMSSDDEMSASASNGSLKIWNIKTGACIRTFECGYALCVSFLPGDKAVVIGTKTGELELFDVPSSALIESEKAHDGPVWSLQVHPDGKSLITGSADKQVKFWDIGVEQEIVPGTKRMISKLKLTHTRTLKLADDVLCVRISPDAKLIAVSLLDATVKVFFVDTLKFYLSLYGHKLPVLSMDIASDSKLLVTCSADKNVKLWGLDFGDCHKSIFAHQDSIMQVVFEKEGHNFFTCSKDKLVKYWDGDKFENIMKLEGHHGEIWALAVSSRGDFIVSGSHDRSIRVWEQTDDQVFLEEQREKEMEELYEQTLVASLDQEGQNPEDADAEAISAGKQTMETLMAGERIMEALDLGMEDIPIVKAWEKAKAANPNLAPPPRNAIFVALGNITAERYVLDVVQKVKPAHLQDALLVLPFDKVIALLTFIDIWAAREWNIPLICRILFFLLKTHQSQIVANRINRPMLDSVRSHLRKALQKQKDVMGYNLAALRYIKREWESYNTKDFLDEEKMVEEQNKQTKKRVFSTVA